MKSELDGVKFKRLLGLVKALEDSGARKDSNVSFEFIVGSLFPNVLQNIQNEIKSQYTKGYLEGLKEEKKSQNKE